MPSRSTTPSTAAAAVATLTVLTYLTCSVAAGDLQGPPESWVTPENFNFDYNDPDVYVVNLNVDARTVGTGSSSGAAAASAASSGASDGSASSGRRRLSVNEARAPTAKGDAAVDGVWQRVLSSSHSTALVGGFAIGGLAAVLVAVVLNKRRAAAEAATRVHGSATAPCIE